MESDCSLREYHSHVSLVLQTRSRLALGPFSMSMADPQSDSNDRHVIKMYDVNARDGKHCLYTITEHREEIRALEFSPEGDLFLSCAEDGMLNIWHTEVCRLSKAATR